MNRIGAGLAALAATVLIDAPTVAGGVVIALGVVLMLVFRGERVVVETPND